MFLSPIVAKRVFVTLLITTPVLTLVPIEWTRATDVRSGSGENIFRAKCAVCHGIDGSGRTPNGKKLKVPDLRSDEVQKLPDDELSDIITNGKGYMPPFEKKVSADKLQQVIIYVRSLAGKN
jgi:mono/diheme cytochrome c family protein